MNITLEYCVDFLHVSILEDCTRFANNMRFAQFDTHFQGVDTGTQKNALPNVTHYSFKQYFTILLFLKCNLVFIKTLHFLLILCVEF